MVTILRNRLPYCPNSLTLLTLPVRRIVLESTEDTEDRL